MFDKRLQKMTSTLVTSHALALQAWKHTDARITKKIHSANTHVKHAQPDREAAASLVKIRSGGNGGSSTTGEVKI